MALLHVAASTTTKNLTTQQQIIEFVPTKHVLFTPAVQLANLNAAAATFTLQVKFLDSGNNEYSGSESKAFVKSPTSATAWHFYHDRKYFVPSGWKARLFLQSSNSSDTSVSVTPFLYDPNHATLNVDLIDGYPLYDVLKFMGAVLCGETSGAGTDEETFKGLGVGTTRVVAEVDAAGNRTAVTLTP